MKLWKKRYLSLPLLALSLCLEADNTPSLLKDVQVHLQDPTFQQGVLSTHQGGVITAKGLRIQARHIEYLQKQEKDAKVASIKAEGDLLLEYEGTFFVGSRLEYDLVSHTGTLFEGRTCMEPWFVGGEKIVLDKDGSYTIYGAFITTDESQDSYWSLSAQKANISGNRILSASNLHLNFFHIPFLWFPSLKSNLKFFSDPPIRYKVVWDKGLGPRFTMRYRFFSNEDVNLFFRFDYRITEGPGAALESEYFSKDERTTFVTRSYGAYNKVVPDEHGLKRYRLQGLFTHESEDKKTFTQLTYDKFHDLKMLSDFPSSDFEIDTQKRTRLLINHQEEIAFASLNLEPRVNPFESINQQLPLVKAGIKPFPIGLSGIVSENYVSAGYLDYVYASDLLSTYPALKETHSARLQTQNRLYRPFSTGPLHLTPSLGILAIFYGNSPSKASVGQGMLTYGGRISTSPLYHTYATYRHSIEPYADYFGLTRPLSSLDDHYIFNIEDGFIQINSIKVGVRNRLMHRLQNPSYLFSPNLLVDLYTYGFFYDSTFQKTFPKGYLLAAWKLPTYLIQAHTCWNFEESLLDFCNVLTEITVSAQTALAFELRHRSRYDWRKGDHENFLLDVARPIPELVDSPLSDKRNTFLTRLEFKVTPKWTWRFSSHLGWGRLSEPSYNSYKLDTFFLIASHWKCKFSYMHTTNDDRFGLQIQLVK